MILSFSFDYNKPLCFANVKVIRSTLSAVFQAPFLPPYYVNTNLTSYTKDKIEVITVVGNLALVNTMTNKDSQLFWLLSCSDLVNLLMFFIFLQIYTVDMI